jgi:hypothetical protein
MGYDGKYGRVTTEHGDIPGDEPVLVFRARDMNTVALIESYFFLCKENGSPKRHLALVAGALAQFLAWQDANADKVRVPDSERSRSWMES